MSNIIKATKDDLPKLATMLFNSEIGRKYYPTYETLYSLMEESFDNDLFYMLFHKEEIAGFIWFQKNGAFHTFTYLHMIFVKEEYRGHGYGKKLLDYLEEASLYADGKKKLQSKVFLLVGDWNHSAINFYDHAGYTKLSTIPGLFRKRIDEHLMMKGIFG